MSASGRIEDVQIQVDKPEDSGLTIYNTETKKNLEYIDDPSKTPPKTGIAYVFVLPNV